MAERRMFAKSVIESDAFLDLPATARLLYFDLGMRGDDDGFVDSPKRIMRLTGASDDDLRLLIAKQFLIPFMSGVTVVRHWKLHNYIRSDRYKPTQYQEEKSQLTEGTSGVYYTRLSLGIPNDYQLSTECLPLGSIGKDSIIENNINTLLSEPAEPVTDEKEKKQSKKSGKKPHYEQDSRYYKAACWLKKSIESRYIDYKPITESQLQGWANEARLLIERDNRDPDLTNALLEFSQADTFWQSNILSMGKFRAQYDKLLAKYQSQLKGKKEKSAECYLGYPDLRDYIDD